MAADDESDDTVNEVVNFHGFAFDVVYGTEWTVNIFVHSLCFCLCG